jgi:A/G-specific adenine glycosylase
MDNGMKRSPEDNAKQLLAWYDIHRRKFPWRAEPTKNPNVYYVWISEIMLQQTRSAAVIPYFNRFIARWPTLKALACTPRDEVLHAWSGLGYYARARNLHACAQALVKHHGGTFPSDVKDLCTLPGIGSYTASAISAIAFDQPAIVIDSNVERIMARLFTVAKPISQAKPQIERLARKTFPSERPGDFAQALMDLGAQICTPKNPVCGNCPWSNRCEAHKSGNPGGWPIRNPKSPKLTRFGIVFWIEHPSGAVLLRKRPDRGMLGGMTEIISSEWLPQPISFNQIEEYAPISHVDWSPIERKVQHTFSHFKLELCVYKTESTIQPKGAFWCPLEKLTSQPFPTLMKKIIALISSTEHTPKP